MRTHENNSYNEKKKTTKIDVSKNASTSTNNDQENSTGYDAKAGIDGEEDLSFESTETDEIENEPEEINTAALDNEKEVDLDRSGVKNQGSSRPDEISPNIQ